jgi:2-polyprenyl-3-methyl-5-hydroxy-6-metoxy-1,4-benzoquinol methylase
MRDTESAQTGHTTCWLCGGLSQPDDRYGRVSLYRCADCGFLFAPERSTEELHELYTDEYFEKFSHGDSYTADEVQRRYEARQRLKWMRDFTPPGRLMEIGAAAGIFLDEARKLGYDVFGIEPATGLAQDARSRLGVDVAVGFIETAPIPTEPFDVVCAWHVLEHIRQPQSALLRLRKALRDGGYLFLEIPNIESDQAGRHGPDWFHLDPANHVGFYTTDQLREVLRQAEFELTETTSVSGLSYLRPRLALRPTNLAFRALVTVRSRALQGRPHPHKHELMRAVARPV